jgi:pimeloyl-ACP methyl ester carboxylesterase
MREQARSGFRYGYSIYQAEYSRNLLFRSGGQMEELFNRILDRTRSRLDIPSLRTIFGLKARPHRNRDDVRAFCATLEIERPILLGQSFGSFVALGVAARYPQLPRKLIVSSGAGRIRFDRALEMIERLGGPDARQVTARNFEQPTADTQNEYLRVCLPLYTLPAGSRRARAGRPAPAVQPALLAERDQEIRPVPRGRGHLLPHVDPGRGPRPHHDRGRCPGASGGHPGVAPRALR